jgi:hypothetical protein
MDKALPSGGRDCGFESRLGLALFLREGSVFYIRERERERERERKRKRERKKSPKKEKRWLLPE